MTALPESISIPVSILLLLTTELLVSGWMKVLPPLLLPLKPPAHRQRRALHAKAERKGHRTRVSEPSSTQNHGRIRSPAKEAGGKVKMGILFSTSKNATSPHS